VPELSETARNVLAEQFYAALGIQTRFGGGEAFYNSDGDYVQLPPFERFRDGSAFYSTLLHEGAHATAAPHRLNRDLAGRFGSEAYAFEELIAEWASAMACMTLELTPEPRIDHAQYIASWLKLCSPRHNSSNREVAIMRRNVASGRESRAISPVGGGLCSALFPDEPLRSFDQQRSHRCRIPIAN